MVRISKGTGSHDVCKTHTCAINISANIEATQKHIRHALEYFLRFAIYQHYHTTTNTTTTLTQETTETEA